jgi:hypothetical protein
MPQLDEELRSYMITGAELRRLRMEELSAMAVSQ